MKIVIPGGSGQVGTVLARAFHAEGHDVVVLSRRPERQPWRVVGWDGATRGLWCQEFDGADAVINLAGRSVNCRYNSRNRREILESRVLSTHAVGAAISGAHRPPRVWLQASTATIYAHRFDAANDEYTGVLGGGEPQAPSTWKFSIDVATAWEREFAAAATPLTRKVALRSAMTMSPDSGGIFDTLHSLARCGLGGNAGDGRQFISWIHFQDFIAALRWIMDREELSGTINVTSPGPVPNSEFMSTLRRACRAPFGLPATNWMLELGAVFLRTETELILKSRRVVPARLLKSGFTFQFPRWEEAALDLCRQWDDHRVKAAA
jgi:uncharacterized protein (TIGR01777 family)